MNCARATVCFWAVLLAALGGMTVGGCNTPPAEPQANAKDDTAFESGANRAPTANTRYALARILAAQGRDKECKIVLGRLLNDEPKFLPAYLDLAELYMRGEQPDEAIAVLQAGLKVSPKNPLLLNNIGMCYLFKKDYAAAADLLGQASAIDPGNARYRSNMALALGMMGRYEEALALYEQVLPSADAHYNMAIIHGARNDPAGAAKEHELANALRGDKATSRPASRPATLPAK